MTDANATAHDPRPGRVAAACCVAMLAAAFLWFWPTLQHGLRSDDYLACYWTDRLTGAIHWGRVFEEFVRPWFGVGELYRPLVSLTYSIELALFPSPAARHAFNVLFVAITAAATAATAALLATHRRAFAACLAGAVVVLHPATVETAAWISARVTSLQMAACALACWAYTRHLVLGRPLWPSLLWQVLALASKEGAMTLVVTLAAIDCLHAPHERVRTRARRLLPFVVVLGLYLCWRLVLLGRLGPIREDGFSPAHVWNVAVRTLHLAVPPDPEHALSYWTLPLLLAALAPLWRRLGALALLVPLWWLLVLAPSQHIPAALDSLIGRFVFDAVPGLGIVLGLALAAGARRATALGCGAAALVWLAGAAVNSRAWIARFDAEDHVSRSVERALAVAAAHATPARPFACAGLPTLPLFHQKLWGVLGLRPFAARDLAVLGLPELLVPDAFAPEFFADAAPVHAILATGGDVASIDYTTMRFVSLTRAPAATLPLTPGAPHEFVVASGSSWPGTALAAIEVRLPRPAAAVRLRLLDDAPDERAYGWQQQSAKGGTAWFVTAHAVAPILLQTLGVPFRGVGLEVDGNAPAPGTTVVVHAALASRALPQRAAGATRTRDELHALPATPPFREPSRLYLLLPTGVRHMDAPPEGADMSPALREHLRYALDIFAPLTVHWFWQSPRDAPGPPWCSELDWASAR